MKIWEQLPRPSTMRPKNHDRKKYYLYHHDHGHDTEDYIQLHYKIEELIRREKLDHFIQRIKEGLVHPSRVPRCEEQPQQDQPTENQLVVGILYVIIKGHHGHKEGGIAEPSKR